MDAYEQYCRFHAALARIVERDYYIAHYMDRHWYSTR